jgi:UDP-4-amino-4,6-dideoxy-N-acetyl-beta-L-altrosamine transaminase
MVSIPYGRQSINQADIDSVIAVLRSNYLTQGPLVPAFEKAISDYCNVANAVAFNSATSALHVACLALGIKEGDIVWTSPITFVASANCAIYCGATIDFVDIDPRTYNLDVVQLEQKLVLAQKMGMLPQLVIPVHLAGQPCDMVRIHSLSKKYGFKVIEDASHAIGGQYKGLPIGNCNYSDITVFSFHPVKIITSGEGGMALTVNNALAKKMRLLRSHGITNEVSDMQERSDEEIWNYQQIDLGFNYRMTDLQAALGYSQLQRIDQFVEQRHSIARHYNSLLAGCPLVLPYQDAEGFSSYHLYIIRLKLGELNKAHHEVYKELHARGVLVNLHYIPVYRQPYYEKMGFSEGYCPQAEKYFSEALSLPMYPGLTDAEQLYVVNSLHEVMAI